MATDVLNLLSQVIRVGKVTARQPETLRVQVTCEDTQSAPFVSDWLQVIVPRAFGDCVYDLPDVGDQVLCLFLPHAPECGFCLGGMYTGTPPVRDGEKWHRAFSDGTKLEYDRSAHTLSFDIQGNAKISATGDMTISAKKISIAE